MIARLVFSLSFWLACSHVWAGMDIVIEPSMPGQFEPYRFSSPYQTTTPQEVYFGDDLSNGMIVIKPDTDSGARGVFRISIQLETSMSLGDGGPHLDLVDWKHCTTEWQALSSAGQRRFKVPALSSISTDCFPDVSTEEIRAEIFKQGGERWVEVYDQARINGYDATYIDVSTVRFKVEQQIENEWVPVTTLEMALPMGC